MKNLVEFFIKHPVWGNTLVFVLVIWGFIGLFSLNINFFPETEQRVFQIQVVYPGSSPEEIEEGVVLKIEEALKGIEGIEQITSVSSENNASVSVEGKKGYDPEKVFRDVKNAVDRINSFPAGIEKPTVFLAKQVERVATLLLQADVDLQTLKKNAELIEDELLSSGVVSQVSLSGFPDLEISVEVSENNLKKFGIKFDDVANAIKRNNIDVSGGSLKTAEEEILIRSRNKKYDAGSIGELIIRGKESGSLLKIKDVAMVKEQFADVPNKTIYNGNRAVTIDVNKTIDEDMLTISNYVKKYIDEYNTKREVLKLVMSRDSSQIVRQRIEMLTSNGVLGLLLVLIVLGFFLNLRLAFWVALSIPVSFLGMFFIGQLAGITINVISLFGMILVVGILVDDGIVISENIYSHYEKGASPMKAAINGTMEVLGSVFASVSTTIVMFLPFFFLDGRMGEFFVQMAIVVISCLAISLLEAAFILPAHLAHSKALRLKEKSPVRVKIDKAIDYLRYNLYGRTLSKIMKYPYKTMAVVFFFIFTVIGLFQGGFIKGTFFPFVDSDNVSIDLSLEPGARDFQTEDMLKQIEEKVWEVNKDLSAQREDSLQVILSTRLTIGPGSAEKGNIDVELLDGETRNLESFKIASAIREKVGLVPEADKLTFGTRQIWGKPVSISLTGRNLKLLNQAKEKLKEELRTFSTLRDVNDNDVKGKRELNIKLKPMAYSLGLSTQDITKQVRQGFFGDEAQRLQVGSDEVKIWTRYPESDRSTQGKLEDVRIKVADREYPLSELAEFSIERGIVTINHYNGAREIRIEADLVDLNEPVPPIIEKIKKDIAPKIMSDYPGVRVGFEGQDKENQKFAKSAGKAFILAFLTLMLILALTFRSYSQMGLIIMMIPLGILGAVLGHGIEGKPVSIFSFYGIIALVGIIVNDCVVFLDKFNSNLKQGLKIREAAFDAGISRFRAIVLTSLTTIAGLYPLILEKSRQAQFLVPVAISVAWGIMIVTVFTLLFFPVLILIYNDIRMFFNKCFRYIASIISRNPLEPKPSKESVEPAMREIKVLEELGYINKETE